MIIIPVKRIQFKLDSGDYKMSILRIVGPKDGLYSNRLEVRSIF